MKLFFIFALLSLTAFSSNTNFISKDNSIEIIFKKGHLDNTFSISVCKEQDSIVKACEKITQKDLTKKEIIKAFNKIIKRSEFKIIGSTFLLSTAAMVIRHHPDKEIKLMSLMGALVIYGIRGISRGQRTLKLIEALVEQDFILEDIELTKKEVLLLDKHFRKVFR